MDGISKLIDQCSVAANGWVGWKTKLEVNDGGEIKTSRCIRILKGFLQGDSYSPMRFCLTEVPIAILQDDTEG